MNHKAVTITNNLSGSGRSAAEDILRENWKYQGAAVHPVFRNARKCQHTQTHIKKTSLKN